MYCSNNISLTKKGKNQNEMKKNIDKKRAKDLTEKEYSPLSKKELAKLRTNYQKGLLKFDSKDIAEAILKEFKQGLTK